MNSGYVYANILALNMIDPFVLGFHLSGYDKSKPITLGRDREGESR